ncbi:MAG TPA: hypothetical protein VFL68_05820 [Pseudolabrys sp.]|jgi:hypothetical protein|nr:hypothetical protein [Pseudolabrys sp.]
MKYVALAAAVLGLAAINTAGTAKAEDFGVTIRAGEGHSHYRHHDHWRGDYARASHCRVVVTHRINGHGDRVTVRKKVCD